MSAKRLSSSTAGAWLVSAAGVAAMVFIAAEFGAHVVDAPACPLAYLSGDAHAGSVQRRTRGQPDFVSMLIGRSAHAAATHRHEPHPASRPES